VSIYGEPGKSMKPVSIYEEPGKVHEAKVVCKDRSKLKEVSLSTPMKNGSNDNIHALNLYI
jgi:hypothetical protein